jgi:hypothetical protein
MRNIVLLLAVFVAFPVAGGSFAQTVVSCHVGGASNESTDRNTVVGPTDYKTGFGYLSLGGGVVVVDFGSDGAVVDGDGDDLKVYEIGASYSGSASEPFRVFGAENPDGPYLYIGKSGGDTSGFDLSGSGLSRARYIMVMDMPSDYSKLNSSRSPGADIDAVEALHTVGGG